MYLELYLYLDLEVSILGVVFVLVVLVHIVVCLLGVVGVLGGRCTCSTRTCSCRCTWR